MVNLWAKQDNCICTMARTLRELTSMKKYSATSNDIIHYKNVH